MTRERRMNVRRNAVTETASTTVTDIEKKRRKRNAIVTMIEVIETEETEIAMTTEIEIEIATEVEMMTEEEMETKMSGKDSSLVLLSQDPNLPVLLMACLLFSVARSSSPCLQY